MIPAGYRLIIASNRDEFYFRPTAKARFWEKNPNLIAGMDLKPGKEGGAWLGMTTDGKFATVTNYRQAPKFFGPSTTGRGYLVPDFLKGDGNVESYLKTVSGQSEKYHGFNLLVGKLSQTDETKVGWYCNIEDKQVTMMEPGIHVLSNKVLNCSWTKMDYGRKDLLKY
ncbi:Transport and Golgi organization protein 2 [Desmophyllum pertusum]|uniref:Transport and Golgi organization protein 2 n=1 Tax=Desmophyllum pertusum TaxID=174260 RepID=A0A9X0CUZ6_9CNID|nr:Transport and Golgi organization protein 2 [Desmophyllum pertusum]